MTIRDYLAKGKFPNAFSTPRGKSLTWHIPLTDLVAAGLLDSVKADPEPTAQASPVDVEIQALLARLEAENRQLLERVADLKAALERAEKRVDQLLPIQAIETASKQRERRALFWRKNKRSEFETMPAWTPESD